MMIIKDYVNIIVSFFYEATEQQLKTTQDFCSTLAIEED